MKKTLILLALFVPLLLKAQKNAFTVQGKTELHPDNGFVKLLWHKLNSVQRIDTDSSLVDNDGKFVFKGTVSEPEIAQLIYTVRGATQSAVFYLEPGHINISCTTNKRYPQLSGTPLNNDFNEYYNLINVVVDSISAAHPNNAREYSQFSKEINPQKQIILRQLIKEHPGSRLCLYQLGIYAVKAPDDVLNVDAMFKQLSPELRKSPQGLEMALKIRGMASSKIGDTALDFTLPDNQDKMVKLSDFRGKYVLLDFWATWCGPCLQEMPNVARAYEKYKGKNFIVMGVSLDRPDAKAKWKEMIVSQHLNWVQVSDLKLWSSLPALLYNVNGIPANFLIDPKGKIIAKNLRGEALQKKLAEIFDNSVR